ncbi:hypothetical protein HDU97_004112 [Phlyctochytrium planicorne]|nr:hypothetical protein HDU97_004112 [Phlyctochytrium planicorne]
MGAGKRKSRPWRSVVRPEDETERVALGIVRLDVFSMLMSEPGRLLEVSLVGECEEKEDEGKEKDAGVLFGTPSGVRRGSGHIVESGGRSGRKGKGGEVVRPGSPCPIMRGMVGVKLTHSPIKRTRSQGPVLVLPEPEPEMDEEEEEEREPATKRQKTFSKHLEEDDKDQVDEELENHMQILRDLEAIGKWEVARAYLDKIQEARRAKMVGGVPDEFVGDDPRSRIGRLANWSMALTSPVKEEKKRSGGKSGRATKKAKAVVVVPEEEEEDVVGEVEEVVKPTRKDSSSSKKKKKKDGKKRAKSEEVEVEVDGDDRKDDEERMDDGDALRTDLSCAVDAAAAAGDLVSMSKPSSSGDLSNLAEVSQRVLNGPSRSQSTHSNNSKSNSGSSSKKRSSSQHSSGNPPPKTRAAPSKASKPLPDFLGGGRRIKNYDGEFVDVEMSIFNKCDEGSPTMLWKGTRVNIPPTVDRYWDCNPEEIETCSILRMLPSQYLEIKETLLATIVVRGPYKKRDAQGWFRIDVNKTNKLYDWFYSCGWIRVATQEWERREKLRIAGGGEANQAAACSSSSDEGPRKHAAASDSDGASQPKRKRSRQSAPSKSQSSTGSQPAVVAASSSTAGSEKASSAEGSKASTKASSPMLPDVSSEVDGKGKVSLPSLSSICAGSPSSKRYAHAALASLAFAPGVAPPSASVAPAAEGGWGIDTDKVVANAISNLDASMFDRSSVHLPLPVSNTSSQRSFRSGPQQIQPQPQQQQTTQQQQQTSFYNRRQSYNSNILPPTYMNPYTYTGFGGTPNSYLRQQPHLQQSLNSLYASGARASLANMPNTGYLQRSSNPYVDGAAAVAAAKFGQLDAKKDGEEFVKGVGAAGKEGRKEEI